MMKSYGKMRLWLALLLIMVLLMGIAAAPVCANTILKELSLQVGQSTKLQIIPSSSPDNNLSWWTISDRLVASADVGKDAAGYYVLVTALAKGVTIISVSIAEEPYYETTFEVKVTVGDGKKEATAPAPKVEAKKESPAPAEKKAVSPAPAETTKKAVKEEAPPASGEAKGVPIKEASAVPDPKMEEMLERVKRGAFYYKDFSEEGIISALTETTEKEPAEPTYGDRFKTVLTESRPMSMLQIMRMPLDRRYRYIEGEEKHDEHAKGLGARILDLFLTPVGFVVGTWTDFFDNLSMGDGIPAALLKSLTGNFVYGTGGTVLGSADLILYAFTPKDQIGTDDYGPQEIVKGANNWFVDRLLGTDYDELIKRTEQGHYKSFVKEEKIIEQSFRQIREDYEMRQFQSEYY